MLPASHVDLKTGRALVSTATQCGRFLVVAGEDGTIRTWDARFWLFKKALKRQEGGITSLAVNSTHLFSGSRDGTIIAWNRADWIPEYRMSGFCSGIRALACNERLLLYHTFVFGTTGMIDTRKRERLSSVWEAKKYYGNTIDFAITATRLVTTTDEGEIHVWDIDKHDLLRSFRSNEKFPIACIDDRFLAYVEGNHGITIVDVASWHVITRIDLAPEGSVYCLKLDRDYLAAGLDDGSAIIWKKGAWTIARTHRRRGDPVVAIVFMDPDAFVVHENGLIDIFKTSSWRWVGKLENKTPSIDEQLAARDKVISRLNKRLAGE